MSYFENLTVSDKDIRDLRELIPMSIYQDEDFNRYTTLRKVNNGDPVGLIGELEDVGKAGAGCDPEYVEAGIANAEKRWELGDWEIPIKICYESLEGTIAEWQLKTGTEVGDLTSTEFMSYIMRPALERAMKKMIWRFGWFGDKNAANVTDGGIITDGVDETLFTTCDGLWKLLFAIGTAHASQLTSIAANSRTTTAAQKAAMLTQGVATGIFDKILMDADSRISGNSESVILCTKALADALTWDVKKEYKVIMPWEKIFDGVEVSEYGGVKVARISIWDRMIAAYENQSAYANKPYRAVYADIRNLQIGTNANGLLSTLDVWFDRKERRNYIYSAGKIGAMVVEDELVHLAY